MCQGPRPPRTYKCWSRKPEIVQNYTSIDPDSYTESHDLLTCGWLGWSKKAQCTFSLHSQLTAPPKRAQHTSTSTGTRQHALPADNTGSGTDTRPAPPPVSNVRGASSQHQRQQHRPYSARPTAPAPTPSGRRAQTVHSCFKYIRTP